MCFTTTTTTTTTKTKQPPHIGIPHISDLNEQHKNERTNKQTKLPPASHILVVLSRFLLKMSNLFSMCPFIFYFKFRLFHVWVYSAVANESCNGVTTRTVKQCVGWPEEKQ